MRNLILLIIVIFIFPRCAPESKPNTNCRNYTKISHIMGDSNLVVDLPNLIESESNYNEIDIFDVGIYNRFVLECKSLIGKDTVITKIESSFYFSIVKDPASQNDTLLLNSIANSFLARMFDRKLVFKKVKIINGRKMFIVKVGDGDLTSYNVLYLSKSNYTSLIIDGIKNEEIFNQILQSIDIEERKYFLCL